jgi:hypothetical protein
MDSHHPRRADPAGNGMSKSSIFALAVAALVAMAVVLALLIRDDNDDQRQRPLSPSQVSVVLPTSPANGESRAEQSPPPLPVSQAAEARAGTPEGPHTDSRLDEQSLVSRLRDLSASDPPLSLALALAREALARFPHSADAPEFEWNVVKAFANMDRYLEAEKEARTMLERYPGNPFSDDVEHHLLNHPPNPRNVPDP